jgi:hypothetical protein
MASESRHFPQRRRLRKDSSLGCSVRPARVVASQLFRTAHQAQEFRRPEQNVELDGHRHEKPEPIDLVRGRQARIREKDGPHHPSQFAKREVQRVVATILKTKGPEP